MSWKASQRFGNSGGGLADKYELSRVLSSMLTVLNLPDNQNFLWSDIKLRSLLFHLCVRWNLFVLFFKHPM